MRSTIRLGRIAGIEVGINWSLLVIAALLVTSLSGDVLPAWAPQAKGSYLAAAILAVGLFFASILAHELARSVVARRQGQPVSGITLWLLGGVSRLGSEARTANDELRVAIAGPATSLALGVGFGVLAFAFDAVLPAGGLLPVVAWYLAVVNVVLGLFNLLPGAPLDGGRVLSALLWKRRGDRRSAQISAARAGRFLGIALIAGSIFFLLNGAGTFFTALVGLFVLSASREEEEAARTMRALDNRTVGDLARPITNTAADWTTVATFGPNPEPTLLTGWDGNATALLPPGAVFAVPPEFARAHVQLRAIALPLTQLRRVPLDAPAAEVARAGLPVIVDDADGRPFGLFGLDELKQAVQRDPLPAPKMPVPSDL